MFAGDDREVDRGMKCFCDRSDFRRIFLKEMIVRVYRALFRCDQADAAFVATLLRQRDRYASPQPKGARGRADDRIFLGPLPDAIFLSASDQSSAPDPVRQWSAAKTAR